MLSKQSERFLEGITQKRGKQRRLRRKFERNREQNWFLALTLNSFAKLAVNASLTDLEQIIVDAFREHGFTDEELQEQGQIYQQLTEQVRREIFPGKFAELGQESKYSLNDLKIDLPQIEEAILSMQNVTNVDTQSIQSGVATLRDFPMVSRTVLQEHGSATLRIVTPNTRSSNGDAYKIKAVKFRCNEETGIDWTGSDEPYWIFASTGAGNSVTTRSRVFGNVDTGNRRDFDAEDGCLWGQLCTPQSLPDGEIGIHIQLWEHDSGDPERVRQGVDAAFKAAADVLSKAGVDAWITALVTGVGEVVHWLVGFLDEDHIADQTFVFDHQFLESQVSPGQSFDLTRRFANGDGDYTLTINISRIAEVTTPIQQKYTEVIQNNPWIGNPIIEEAVCPDGVGHFRHYEHASIYWHPQTGAHLIYGLIRDKWAALGWERSPLGYPTTDEANTGNGRGRYNDFQNGSIHWSSGTLEAFAVYGAIFQKWGENNWDSGSLGFPLTDETSAPDSIGRYNRFEGGYIYWSPQTGAFVTDRI